MMIRGMFDRYNNNNRMGGDDYDNGYLINNKNEKMYMNEKEKIGIDMMFEWKKESVIICSTVFHTSYVLIFVTDNKGIV